MSNIQPLDNVAHAQMRLVPGHSAAQGDAINQVPVALSEFAELQRHYPILFVKDPAGKLQAVAILGLDKDENLFLTAEGGWDGYVPAVIRRGPFMLGRADGDDIVIHVDADHPRVAPQGADGLPLFLEQGGHAPVLEYALDALRSLHHGAQHQEAMQELFEELGLLEEAEIKIELAPGRGMNFEGFLALLPEKIEALEGAALEKLNKAGMLLPAVFAAASLGNIHRLVMRKRVKDAG